MGGATIVIGGDNVPPILMSAGDRGYKNNRWFSSALLKLVGLQYR